MSYTDRFGATHPNAIFTVTNYRFQHDPLSADFDMTVYVDQTAKDGGIVEPLEQRPRAPFTAAEIASVENALAMAVYQVLKARAEFQNATIVTP